MERNAFRDQLAKLRKEMESQKSEHEKALISSHADLQLQLSEVCLSSDRFSGRQFCFKSLLLILHVVAFRFKIYLAC